ncbi:contractile injection system tape measure protein [Echinicola vietnamensis]|uniref:Uncharacterized protein n=1 Tax=Echinicola vietnamensis (strain DSM 17526 / LMG 23754 / KMM 6221) TaxID=926556 RepID=L0G2N6_ECHVK|nr:contractile injection system tape measure protein [Echinicola vietnamensis]AGA79802.1 hypothetical protein Echvi_3586 [Echinicola vietnamensis DSM 17526]
MNDLTSHILHKVLVELNVSDQKTGFAIQNSIASFVQKELLPLLEEHFNEMEQQLHGSHLQIPQFNIHLHGGKKLFNSQGSTSHQLVLDHLLEQFSQQVEQQLRQWSKKVRLERSSWQAVSPITIPSDLHGQEKTAKNRQLTKSQRDAESIIYILTHGSNPWWLHEDERVKFFSDWSRMDASLKECFKQPQIQSFFKEIAKSPAILKRLIQQISNNQLEKIYGELSQFHYELTFIQSFKTLVNTTGDKRFRTVFWQTVFGSLSRSYFERNFVTDVKQLWQEGLEAYPEGHHTLIKIVDQLMHAASDLHRVKSWMNNYEYIHFKEKYDSLIKKYNDSETKPVKNHGKNNLLREMKALWEGKHTTRTRHTSAIATPAEIASTSSNADKEESQLATGIIVNQAGLVMLHPFIGQLFRSVKLLAEDNTIQNKTLATHLLHYVATKQENAFEQDMVFEKYSCNVGLETSLEREVSLSKDMKSAAEEMLAAAIGHWTALKNTHVDTLRAEFLCRPGKLITKENHHKLIIERKTQDILMDQLPWNIGLVKFPWKKQLLFVEW